MMMRGRTSSFTLILLLWFFDSKTFVHAQPDPFYPGKQIRIIVGASAGGFYDRWARLLARFIPKYLPGNPNMIVQTMPGAGSLVATNYVYSLSNENAARGVRPIHKRP
jgi:tripartite-type tricarboxylate transporter receptor subunit TctC